MVRSCFFVQFHRRPSLRAGAFLPILAVAIATAGCSGGGDTDSPGIPSPPSSRYTVVPLEPLPGDDASGAAGINDAGVVAGTSWSGSSPHAVFWSAGASGHPGSLLEGKGAATGIDDAGTIVGYRESAIPGQQSSFRWRNGGLAELPVPVGSIQALASGVSGDSVIGTIRRQGVETPQGCIWQGDSLRELPPLTGSVSAHPNAVRGISIVGETKTGPADNATYLPFQYQGTALQALPLLPGGTTGSATATRDEGRLIAGWTDRPGDPIRGVLWKEGKATDLGTLPGRVNSPASDVNEAGQIVGFSGIGEQRHAYLWENGRMQDLNDLIPANSGWTLSLATGINRRGQIIGYGIQEGRSRAYLLTPRN